MVNGITVWRHFEHVDSLHHIQIIAWIQMAGWFIAALSSYVKFLILGSFVLYEHLDFGCICIQQDCSSGARFCPCSDTCTRQWVSHSFLSGAVAFSSLMTNIYTGKNVIKRHSSWTSKKQNRLKAVFFVWDVLVEFLNCDWCLVKSFTDSVHWRWQKYSLELNEK